MTDEVERLAIAPFREIVEKGNAAIENVPNADEETSPLMLKAAQNLVREGERALKRIEPLCTKNFEEYGVNFVDAIKENGKIYLSKNYNRPIGNYKLTNLFMRNRRNRAVSIRTGGLVMGFRRLCRARRLRSRQVR